jgi:hypothetical protein
MEKGQNNSCNLHRILLVKCTFENCEKGSSPICKYCVLNSREHISHLADHFDYIKKIYIENENGSIDSFENSLKSEEEYGDLNKIFKDIYEKSRTVIDSIFDQIQNQRLIMTEQYRNTLLTKYELFTNELEELIKTLSQKLNSVNSKDTKLKEEILKMKKELDAKLNLLSNPDEIFKDLEQLINKIESLIKKLKVEDILNNKFNLDILKKLPVNLELTTGGNRINVTPRGSSYWATKSVEVLEGAFICKIRVVSINSNSVGSYWNYAVGIIRSDSTNDTSYYNDSVIMQSNGYIPEKFSGSGSTRQLFTQNWENGDVIIIKRDENNSVFFGINDENSLQLAFHGIIGKFRIVLGFSTSMNGDIFELEELNIL